MTQLAKIKYSLIGLGTLLLIFRLVTFFLWEKTSPSFFSSLYLPWSTDKKFIASAPLTISVSVTPRTAIVVSADTNQDMTSIARAGDTDGQISAIRSSNVSYSRKTYTVQEGDTLASIALKVYGDDNAWTTIAKANSITSPDAIEIGMILKLPGKK